MIDNNCSHTEQFLLYAYKVEYDTWTICVLYPSDKQKVHIREKKYILSEI